MRDAKIIRKTRILSHINPVKYKENLQYLRKKYERDKKDLFMNEIQEKVIKNDNVENDRESLNEEDNSSVSDDVHTSLTTYNNLSSTEHTFEQIDLKINIDHMNNKSNSLKEESKELLSPTTPHTNYLNKKKKIKKSPTSGILLKEKENIGIVHFNEEMKSDEFEPIFLKRIKDNKRVILKVEPKEFDYMSYNLFDFTFEKAKDYKNFYFDYNLVNSLKRMQKYLRIRERKLRKQKLLLKKDK